LAIIHIHHFVVTNAHTAKMKIFCQELSGTFHATPPASQYVITGILAT
jgi:hypothetical protein